MSKIAGSTATLGLRAHSGWAAVVALAGPASAPRVLARQRLEFADPKLAYSKQPYHAAAELSLAEAEEESAAEDVDLTPEFAPALAPDGNGWKQA